MNNVQQHYCKNRQEWREWLDRNHDKENAIWLVFDKGKNRTMSWQDIVEEALCFGWIDSRPGKVSETQSKIYVSKRKPKSVWSKINKNSVEHLMQDGLIKPAGLRSIEIAKENGSWNALDLSDNLTYPEELKRLFEKDQEAKHNFESFPLGSKRNTLQWIYSAKTDATRLKRIQETYKASLAKIRLR